MYFWKVVAMWQSLIQKKPNHKPCSLLTAPHYHTPALPPTLPVTSFHTSCPNAPPHASTLGPEAATWEAGTELASWRLCSISAVGVLERPRPGAECNLLPTPSAESEEENINTGWSHLLSRSLISAWEPETQFFFHEITNIHPRIPWRMCFWNIKTGVSEYG